MYTTRLDSDIKSNTTGHRCRHIGGRGGSLVMVGVVNAGGRCHRRRRFLSINTSSDG